MIGHLQQLHKQYEDKGLVLLGLNCYDPKSTGLAFLRSYGVTFPNILDTSNEARSIVRDEYQAPGKGGVPLEYIIDRDGKIVIGWYGSGGNLGEKTLNRLGIK
jgi:peroxiredoxin